jgi:hypothetical protein
VLKRSARAIASCRLGEPGVQPFAHLVGGERAPLPLAASDHDSGRGNAGNSGETDNLPPPHAFTVSDGAARDTDPMTAASTPIPLEQALELTRTGDLWLFRGTSAADRAIRVTTNAPVNHVGMAVVLDDLPPLMWHAELGQALVDLWTGKHQRGVQLHDLRDSVLVWANRYGQRGWLRQLDRPVTQQSEDALLRTIARLDGTPFPTTGALARGFISGRVPRRRTTNDATRETAYCAEVVAISYQDMGLLPGKRRPTWYDPGRFWSGDSLQLDGGYALSGEIPIDIPAE